MRWPEILLFLFVALRHFGACSEVDDDLWEAYANCSSSWTNVSWVCDPDSLLSSESTGRLELLLTRLQTQTPCFCKDSNLCYRFEQVPIKSGFAAALLVVEQLPLNSTLAQSTAESIYEQTMLPHGDCDNGLLLIYGVTNHTVLSYRGTVSYITLSSADEDDIQQFTRASLRSGNGRAIATMVEHYTIKLAGRTRFSESLWETWVGFVAACVVVILVLSLLVAICCSGICGKTKQQRRFARVKKIQESLYASFCRSEEPIYVISEPESVCNYSNVYNQSTMGSRPQSQHFTESPHEIQKKECFISE